MLTENSCSLSCFKIHKPTHAELANDSTSSTATVPQLPQPSAPAPVPRYLKQKIDFSALATNHKFQELIKTYPNLLQVLQRVYAATIEPDPDDEARRRRLGRGAFRGRGSRGRGRGRGGRFGGYDDENSRWTPKKGDADAMKMLKEVRSGEADGKDKEAMRAFVDLIEENFGRNDKMQEGD